MEWEEVPSKLRELGYEPEEILDNLILIRNTKLVKDYYRISEIFYDMVLDFEICENKEYALRYVVKKDAPSAIIQSADDLLIKKNKKTLISAVWSSVFKDDAIDTLYRLED